MGEDRLVQGRIDGLRDKGLTSPFSGANGRLHGLLLMEGATQAPVMVRID